MAFKKKPTDTEEVVAEDTAAPKKSKGPAPIPTQAPQVAGQSAATRLMGTAMMTALRKKLGDKVIVSASDFKDETTKLPTGIFPLDYALGGGFPLGRFSIVYGKKSSSKTTTIIRALANAQKMCANCHKVYEVYVTSCSCEAGYREPAILYLDVEGAFHKGWAEGIGLDMNRLLFSRPQFAEEAVDIMDAAIRSGECDIVVLDSIAFMVPLKEQDKSAQDATEPALQARLVGQMIRKTVSGAIGVARERGKQPTVFLINQIREKVGVMFGSPETSPGGNAPGYAASIELKFSPGKIESDPASGMPLMGEFPFKIEKNKLNCTVKMEGSYKLQMADTNTKKRGEIRDEGYVVAKAQELEIITGAGSSWYCMDEHYNAKSLIEKRMETDKAFSRKLRDVTMALLLKTL